MSKEIESVSTALFDKIRSRFPGITLGDEKAKACTDPSKARFFNFTYTGEDGAQFGKVTAQRKDISSDHNLNNIVPWCNKCNCAAK